MTVYYVRSTDGSDASDGLTWANAKATLSGAFTAMSAGDRCWVSQSHAETQASAMTLTSPGTSASNCEVLCGNDASEPPTAHTTGATITTTGASDMTFIGYCYYNGIDFSCGTGGAGANFDVLDTESFVVIFEDCIIRILTNNSNSRIRFGAAICDSAVVKLINVQFEYGHTDALIITRCNVFWRGGSFITDTINPNRVMGPFEGNGIGPIVDIRGADFSGLNFELTTSGGRLAQDILFENCKMGSSNSFGSEFSEPAGRISYINVDSGGTNYRYFQMGDNFTCASETTIVRSKGATNGVVPFSRKLITTADKFFYSPYRSDRMSVWNEVTGKSLTVSIEIISDNVTFDDDEVWIEVEALTVSGSTRSTFTSDGIADLLTTPTAQETSNADWNTTGLTTPVKQKCSVAVTPENKGPINIQLCVAKPSITLYYCPRINIT